MRKCLLTLALLAGLSTPTVFAQFGNCTASEMQTYVDSRTGKYKKPPTTNGKRLNLMMIDITPLNKHIKL